MGLVRSPGQQLATFPIWLVGSAVEPPGEFLVLHDATVTVVKDGAPTRPSAPPSTPASIDPLQVNDPWARFTNLSIPNSSAPPVVPVQPITPKVQTVVETRIVEAERRLADQMQTMLQTARQEFEQQCQNLRDEQMPQQSNSSTQPEALLRQSSA